MLSKLKNVLLAGSALMGIMMLNSGPAIAIESSLSQLKGDSGDMELAACDASDAATFDFAPAEEDALPGKDAFTFQTDADAEEVALCHACTFLNSGVVGVMAEATGATDTTNTIGEGFQVQTDNLIRYGT